ncbi:MAG: PilZ domain-containing protein [Sphingomicrobium sp.]
MKRLTAGVPVERRERRPVSMRGFAVREGGETIEILLLDLSYEGCGIETPAQLKRGDALKISVLGRGAIDTHVRWCKGGKAGLNFDTEAEPAKQQVERGNLRAETTAEVTMRRLGHANFKVRVFDLSAKGCKVELIERPNEREHVLVKFEALEVLEAEVCWIAGKTAGLRFERPIHPAVFDLLVERLR